MIRPDKYMNLDTSVLNISSVILKLFKNSRLISFDEISNSVINKLGFNSKENIIYALNFLYLLNKIEYHQEIDNFEIIRNEVK